MGEDLSQKYITIKLQVSLSDSRVVKPIIDTNMDDIEQVTMLSMLFKNQPKVVEIFTRAFMIAMDPGAPGPIGWEKRYGKER